MKWRVHEINGPPRYSARINERHAHSDQETSDDEIDDEGVEDQEAEDQETSDDEIDDGGVEDQEPEDQEPNDQAAEQQQHEGRHQAIGSLEEAIVTAVKLPSGTAILRAFNLDMELISPDYLHCRPTLLSNVLGKRVGLVARHEHLRDFERLNMLTFIPELSLVVAASQTGRVALITPLRLVSEDDDEDGPSKPGDPQVMLRLDMILPMMNHDALHRPGVPLSGSKELISLSCLFISSSSSRLTPGSPLFKKTVC